MRLTGWILLLIGGLLCATIAWAALGFLLMGVGLISLQVAERRRQRADDAPIGAVGFTPPLVGAGLQPPTLDPVIRDDAPSPRRAPRVAWPDKKSGAPYDREAWRRLVENDRDIAQLARVLSDYGPQYVEELATSYLAAPDKARLGAIVDGIIARARNSQPLPSPAPPQGPERSQGSRPPPLPRPEPQLAIAPPDRVSAAPQPPSAPAPANHADALEASLIAAVEEASAKAAAERTDPPKPARAAEGRSPPITRREPAFRTAPRDSKLIAPPPVPESASTDLEASLIAAVTEAAAKRADPPTPTPERTPVATKREREIRVVASPEPKLNELKPSEPKPVPPPAPAATASADDLDEALLAALAEISGRKLEDAPKPDAAPKDPPKDPPGPPPDDDLSEMIKKFAPDSNFLRKQ